MISVNKVERPKFDSSAEVQKHVSDKAKSIVPSSNKVGSGSKGKNQTRRTKKPFGLNILVENIVVLLKEKYGVWDPILFNPYSKSI